MLEQRYSWIQDCLDQYIAVDVLNEEFVIGYINEFKPDYQVRLLGAPKCSQLSKDLGAMYKEGRLNRSAIGLPLIERGFPKWVYVYTKKELDK